MEAPRLTRGVIESLRAVRRTGIELPPAETLTLPEKVVQFGTGAFLRGFIEYFIDEANRDGRFGGSIVAVSSTGGSRNAVVNAQGGLFTLAVRGMESGVARQRYRVLSSLSRAVSARDEWDTVLEVARDPRIELIVSNTTEVGIAIDDEDRFGATPPLSFPAKLTRFLAERGAAFEYAHERGLMVLPCELVERNGDTLRGLVLETARRWALGNAFQRWVEDSIVFCNTLVDRIVPGAIAKDDASQIARVFGYRDELITACEPYALFAIEGDDTVRARLGFAGDDARIIVAPNIQPFRERKVRVLNGAHTVLVSAALLSGFATVRDACKDERIGRFLHRAVFDEIVPMVDAPGAVAYAADVLERFANPYIDHALIDITLHCTAKMRVRVVPSILAFADPGRAGGGRTPASLAFGFAAYLGFKRGELQAERDAAGLPVPDDSEGRRVEAAWAATDPSSDAAVAALARTVCADASLWGADLTTVGGFADAVAEHLVRIVRLGIGAALDAHLTEPATA